MCVCVWVYGRGVQFNAQGRSPLGTGSGGSVGMAVKDEMELSSRQFQVMQWANSDVYPRHMTRKRQENPGSCLVESPSLPPCDRIWKRNADEFPKRGRQEEKLTKIWEDRGT